MATPAHVHLDAVGGIAGDMFVAALLDARPDLADRVFSDLHAADPHGHGTPALAAGLSGGIAVQRFVLTDAEGAHAHVGHPHDGHAHGTGYAELAARIAAARLAAGTADHAIAILTRIAEAESRLHRVPLAEVHFHELADWDSLMDVVAAGSIAAALAGSTWSVSPLPLGGGLVSTRHGQLPVPAPATAELLRGFEWRDDGVPGERVTPTGAAILAHLRAGALPSGPLRLAGIGIGAGTRELPGMPNILRAMLYEGMPAVGTGTRDEVAVIGFEVDDMTGEEIAIAADRLRAAAGVVDVTVGMRQGKKGRPLADFRLMVQPGARDAAIRLCFEETATLGLRWRVEQRCRLERRGETVTLDGAAVRRKRRVLPDGTTAAKVESDALAPIAGLEQRRRLKARAEGGEGGA